MLLLQCSCSHRLSCINATGPECQFPDHWDAEKNRCRERQHLDANVQTSLNNTEFGLTTFENMQLTFDKEHLGLLDHLGRI